MQSYILVRTVLLLCFLLETIQVLGQTKEPKDFDLNKTPPPEDGSENEGTKSHYTIENINTESYIPAPKEADVNKSRKKRKQLATDPTEEAERKKVYKREKARERRKGIRERKLAGTLTEVDLRSLELTKARKRRYRQNNKQSLAKYFREYHLNHLSEYAARSRKWRQENLEKARQTDRRRREKKKKQKVVIHDRSAEKHT
ncbi:uncharacterized protein FA14DRAFT_157055 [Meira miltonrushii]|uniref:BZIP domain-containing protein n=1 Tax=Meira miltonrushii TaxID=1280837 RepID=A0A316VEF0_9BASI|nr:uncharacterized protein FA14DRAFT_157055 [Meira miltonrushii]PWN34391.1 hypothetical protein FA14DRAFT_157055 [Meira miltonrushii]